MPLLGQNDLIEINLYYRYVNKGSNKKLVVLSDEKAKELMDSSDENVAKSVEILVTKWRALTWKEQNDVMELSSRSINPQTGEKQFSFVSYRDAVVKKCLKEWNIMVGDKVAPITAEAIDSLPGVIVTSLYQKFDSLSDYTDKDLGN